MKKIVNKKSTPRRKSKSRQIALRTNRLPAFAARAIQESFIRVRNSYEAGGSGRRLKVWSPGAPGPNDSILRDLEQLRNRSRDSVRNNAWIKKGINSWVCNEIGTGIIPRAVSANPDFNQACDQLWDRWTKLADADETLDYYGLTALATRTRLQSGEVFIRLRLRDPDNGLPAPLQLQLLEPDFCPVRENVFFQAGRRVRAGIEFNGIGGRLAYWMFKSHPGDSFFFQDSLELVRVPAENVIHHYAPLRPGQIRGVPWTVQALIKSRDFDEYDDAELVRKKARASHMGIIRRQNYGEEDYKFDPFTGEPLERDSNEVPIMSIEPGSFVNLLPGEDVTLFDGDNTGGGYADFVRQQLLGVAAGLDIPYEFLSGDMAKVNDRVMRVIINEYQRILEQSQWHLSVPQISQRVREAFITAAVLSGALEAPGFAELRDDYFATAWGPQRWKYLHPVQDVQADILEIRAGLSSRKRKVAERGEAVEEIDRENSEDQARADELGLSYSVEGEADEEPESEEDSPPAAAARRGRKVAARIAAPPPPPASPSVTVHPAHITVNQAPVTVDVPERSVTVAAPKTDVTLVTPPRTIERVVTARDKEGRIERTLEREVPS